MFLYLHLLYLYFGKLWLSRLVVFRRRAHGQGQYLYDICICILVNCSCCDNWWYLGGELMAKAKQGGESLTQRLLFLLFSLLFSLVCFCWFLLYYHDLYFWIHGHILANTLVSCKFMFCSLLSTNLNIGWHSSGSALPQKTKTRHLMWRKQSERSEGQGEEADATQSPLPGQSVTATASLSVKQSVSLGKGAQSVSQPVRFLP